jgi:methylglutaconyl-CoA hydratase
MGLGSEQDAHGVLTLTFNDPPTRNALSLDVLANLLDRLYLIDADTRVVVLTGAGATFSSGANRGEIAEHANVERASALMNQLLARLDALEVPVVARVNGPAFGAGLALVAASDIAVAAEDALFGFPEVRFGMVAGPALSAAARRMGETALRDLFLTGRQFLGAEAAKLGLVARAVPADSLEAEVEAVLADLLLGDRAALAETRRLMRR